MIKKFYDFITELKNLNPENCSILSLEVQFLFTIISSENTFNYLENRLSEFHYFDIKIKEFVIHTKFCVSQTTFDFNK